MRASTMTSGSQVGSSTPVDKTGWLTVGEVASRSGVSVSTLHFYERQKLIGSARDSGNRRIYPRGVLRRVAVIKVAQRTGVPLAGIRAALDNLPAGRPLTTSDWRALSSKWKTSLNKRIQVLTALRDQLDSCIGCGCLSLDACPLRNPDDLLGAKGSGPQLLPPLDELDSGASSD